MYALYTLAAEGVAAVFILLFMAWLFDGGKGDHK